MLTLVKYIQNTNPRSNNAIITRTLGKIGALHRESMAQMQRKPKPDEWWYSEVVRETGAGTERGLWVLKPVKQVQRIERDGFRDPDINYLVSNLYTPRRVGNVLLLYPKHKGPNWICSNSMRGHLIRHPRTAGSYRINSIVVVFDDAEDWPRQYIRRNAPILDQGT